MAATALPLLSSLIQPAFGDAGRRALAGFWLAQNKGMEALSGRCASAASRATPTSPA